MDQASRNAVQLLESLAQCKARLIELAHDLREHPRVVTALHAVECWPYGSGSMLELYLDVELREGQALSWWLEVTWGSEAWHIESRVSLIDEQGSTTLKNFPDHTATIYEDFLQYLHTAMSDLVAWRPEALTP
jgi:hypothetical protein